LEHRVADRRVPGDDAHPEDGALVEILRADLGDRDVEARPDPVAQLRDHTPLVLERARVRDVEGEAQDADEHGLPEARSELLLDLLDVVRLEDVLLLDVVVALEADTALEALEDLARVVLEALQAVDLAVPEDRVVAEEAHLPGADDLALDDVAAGDRDALDPEDHPDLGAAVLLLDEGRREEAF